MRVWRIASAAYASFDGEGARRYGSRWTPRGRPAIFTSATLSLAVLERFVNTDPDLEPGTLVSIAVDVDPATRVDVVDIGDLPADWRAYPAPTSLVARGERWLRDLKSAMLSVPSAVVPVERNFIINPAHADFATLTIHPPEPFSFDPRMWKPRG